MTQRQLRGKACPVQTLVTESLYAALRHRENVLFEPLAHDDMLFAYYRASPRGQLARG